MAESSQAQGKDGQDDLAILFPERSTTLAGVPITMREYGLSESLQHHAAIARFTDAITGIALRGDFADLDSLRSAFGECHAEVTELIAVACDQPVDWVRNVRGAEGDQLMMLWWAVNASFFLQRVLLSVGQRKAREFDGGMSSPPSSPMDTTPPISASTRNVN